MPWQVVINPVHTLSTHVISWVVPSESQSIVATLPETIMCVCGGEGNSGQLIAYYKRIERTFIEDVKAISILNFMFILSRGNSPSYWIIYLFVDWYICISIVGDFDRYACVILEFPAHIYVSWFSDGSFSLTYLSQWATGFMFSLCLASHRPKSYNVKLNCWPEITNTMK